MAEGGAASSITTTGNIYFYRRHPHSPGCGSIHSPANSIQAQSRNCEAQQ